MSLSTMLGLPGAAVLMNDDDWRRRALAAYFRTGGSEAQPTARVVKIEGKSYVHLFTDDRTLAIYRVQNVGQLKRLRRWPKEIEAKG